MKFLIILIILFVVYLVLDRCVQEETKINQVLEDANDKFGLRCSVSKKIYEKYQH